MEHMESKRPLGPNAGFNLTIPCLDFSLEKKIPTKMNKQNRGGGGGGAERR